MAEPPLFTAPAAPRFGADDVVFDSVTVREWGIRKFGRTVVARTRIKCSDRSYFAERKNMLELLTQGEYALFMVILFAIIFSLTFHEFGHALVAKLYGDDTAQRLGRLTLNPISHIDPLGLLMVVMVGFGYAKPVPFTAHNLRYPWASALVAFAGPFMNLVLAALAINLYVWGANSGLEFFQGPGPATLLIYLAHINLLLMLFNLIPLGPLDGHHILPHLLPPSLGRRYLELNARYGVGVFLVLIVLSVMGVPIFRTLMDLSAGIIPLITLF